MNDAVRKTLDHIRSLQQAVRTETASRTRLTYVLETTSVTPVDALQRQAEALLGVRLEVRPMFPEEHASGDPDDLELARFHELDIFGLEHGDLPENPFELGYFLQDALDLRSVEPDLAADFANVVEPDDEGDAESAFLGGCWVNKDAPKKKTWALDTIRVPEAWKLKPPSGGKSRGDGVLIGHIDTGINDHAEVDKAALDLRPGANFVEGGAALPIDPLTDSGSFKNPGHGIGTASVIASRQDSKVTGSATQATLLPIRAIRSVVRVNQAPVTKAINYARRQGVQVITMSLGGLPSRSLKTAIKRAVKENILVMAAAGNCVGLVVHPAAQKHCLAIAGTNVDDRPWQGSSHGKAVDVSAPGELVWRAKRENIGAGTEAISGGQGTSFAVALVAGVAALWLAHHGRDSLIASLAPGETLQDRFSKLLRSTARVPSHGQWDAHAYGAGIVDAEALLKADPKGQPATESLMLALEDDDELFAGAIPELVAEATGHERDDLGLNLAERQRYGLELAWLAYNKAQEKLRQPKTSTESAAVRPIASTSLRGAAVRSVSAPLRSLLGRLGGDAASSSPMHDPAPIAHGEQPDTGPVISVQSGGLDDAELVSISNGDITESALITRTVFSKAVVHPGYEGDDHGIETGNTEKILVKGQASQPMRPKRRPDGPLGVIETIIGIDERQRIRETEEVPWRRICALRIRSSGGVAIGTAWLAGPRTLITAGHCVYHRQSMGGWAREIEVTPGQDDLETPFGRLTTRRFSTIRRWVDGQNPDYDIGAIHLDEPLGERLGWFGVASLPDDELITHQINVAGYPADRGDGEELMHHGNRILHVDPRRIYYDVDTFGGQSGSPGWIYRAGETLPTVVGIHAYGEGGTAAILNIKANSAPRLNPAIIRQIERWVQADQARR